MKSLPNVTLISYDNTDAPERTLRALQHCASLIKFRDVILVCRVQPKGGNGETVHLVDESGYASAMDWEVGGIHAYVQTDFALCIHHDGYIINPDQWKDSWFDFDFIGAPWPMNPHPKHPGKADRPGRVGNTGCCLKSRAFMLNTYELSNRYDISSDKKNVSGLGGDTFVSQVIRPELEKRGIKYAPVDVAAGFSWESNIEEYPNGRPDAFGFHNFNLENKKIPRL